MIYTKMLEPDEYHLLHDFCAAENLPVPDPSGSKVVVAIDEATQEVIGIVVAQVQVHTEPIWIKREYQDGKLWKELTGHMEYYLDMWALNNGPFDAWNQPTNAAAERICRLLGYEKCDRPLYVKQYRGEKWQQLRHWLASEQESPAE